MRYTAVTRLALGLSLGLFLFLPAAALAAEIPPLGDMAVEGAQVYAAQVLLLGLEEALGEERPTLRLQLPGSETSVELSSFCRFFDANGREYTLDWFVSRNRNKRILINFSEAPQGGYLILGCQGS